MTNYYELRSIETNMSFASSLYVLGCFVCCIYGHLQFFKQIREHIYTKNGIIYNLTTDGERRFVGRLSFTHETRSYKTC